MKNFGKKAVVTILALVLMAGIATPALARVPWETRLPGGQRSSWGQPEWKVSSWAEEEVNLAINNYIVTQALLNYSPQSQITRGIFANGLLRVYRLLIDPYSVDTSGISFTDNVSTLAMEVAALGLMTGVGDGRFDPGGLLTREQAAVTLVRLLELGNIELKTAPLTFADNDQISSWARESVEIIVAMGIMSGIDGNRFNPRGNYTIEQTIITFLRTSYHLGLTSEGLMASYEPMIFELVNEERRKAGVQPLEWAEPLARAARLHVEECARLNTASHTGADGSGIGDRARRQGWNGNGSFGENIGGGGSGGAVSDYNPATPKQAVSRWMGSTGHRNNILNPEYKYAGVGAALPVGDGLSVRYVIKFSN